MSEYRLKLNGLDCADCAAKLEGKISHINGVTACSIDFMHLRCTYSCTEQEHDQIEKEIRALVKQEEPDVVITVENKEETHAEAEEEDDFHRVPRLIIGAILFVIALFMNGTAQSVLSVIAWLVLGCDVLYAAFKNIIHGKVFDEHFLMSVATIAALYLRDFKEAAGVMLFYQIGEYFQDMAVEKSRKSIGALMDIRPDYAMVQRDGSYQKVDPSEVAIDDIIRVKPGERVPLDGTVISGSSSLDTASLTGESKPRDVDVNDEVLSGSVNQSGVLEIKVTKTYGDSTVKKILDLMENSDSHKANAEKFITKFSRYYTPIVVVAAVCVAILTAVFGAGLDAGIERACTFLVISCPCALVISIPMSFFAGIGGLSSRGVLVKGSNIIEALSKVDMVVMDKTGTLTSGTFAVEETITAQGISNEKLLQDAAYAEHQSNHPIAEGIRKAYAGTVSDSDVTDVKEIAGRGLSVKHGSEEILAGNARLMKDHNIVFEETLSTGTLVYVANSGVYEGCLVLRDQLKPDAIEAVNVLHHEGKKCAVVSGDSKEITEQIGTKLGMDEIIGGCLPADKVETVQNFKKIGTVAFVGDGVNDAPVIASADVGIAMGGLGSDAAIEAADVVIMDDKPSKISLAISSAGRILRVTNENIYFAIIVKFIILILGAFGYANMWMAVFADTGVAMICVLNSLRLLHIARPLNEA
jgi:Cd2+/Zn2+-exporting ATPase